MSRATFGAIPWRSRSHLAAKSCPAHNFVIWSRISNIFHRNDHHIETTCRVQHRRSMWQLDFAAKSCPAHNFVNWSQILKLFHRNDHHIEMMCRAQHLGRYLEGQGHTMAFQQNRVRLITLLFKVGFDKLLLCVQYLFGEHYPVLQSLV